MNQLNTLHLSKERMKYSQLIEEAGLKVEIISGIPVIIIDQEMKDEAIPKVVEFFGENTVFRIINAGFIDDAIEFGTDKGRVDEHDFRRVADGSGYDIWGVEKNAIEQGLKRSDVFCGTPYELFINGGNEFDPSGLGIPSDRAAILVYDMSKLQEIKDSKKMNGITDGYVFIDTEKKKEALLGIIKLKEGFLEFDRELQTLESIDDKILLLEREVFQNLKTKDDLKKCPYIALNIITLLYNESVKHIENPSEISTKRMSKLKVIANRLEYEIKMISFVDDMERQVQMTREAFATCDEPRMRIMQTWPDFVIETVQVYLEEIELDQKYRDILNRVIDDAKRCNAELSIGTDRTIEELQKRTNLILEKT